MGCSNANTTGSLFFEGIVVISGRSSGIGGKEDNLTDAGLSKDVKPKIEKTFCFCKPLDKNSFF
jgi:hypothetical protein